jgi:pyrimidine-nucleoside phosphorylase
MVNIGEGAGRKTVALITNMDTPLGSAIGNINEVCEVTELLKGRGPEDLKTVCLHLAANMLYLAGKGSMEECMAEVTKTLESGASYQKFLEMVKAQHGDPSYIEETEKFAKAKHSFEVVAQKDGYITHMNTEQCGIASVILGAGRETKESEIDFTAGIQIHKKTGDYVTQGETIATLYSSVDTGFQGASDLLTKAYTIGDKKPEEEKLILARVTKDGVERF